MERSEKKIIRRKTIQIYLDNDLHKNIKSVAALEGVPMQQFITNAIIIELQKQGVKYDVDSRSMGNKH